MSPNLSLGETEWSQCEVVIRRFEAAWRGPRRPDLASFVRGDSPYQTQLVVELVHIDLEFRLRAGEDARVEDYLDRFPALADPGRKLDLIAAEYVLRNRHRPPAWPEEFWLRFPEHLADLRTALQERGRPGGFTPTEVVGVTQVPLTVTPTIPGYDIRGELGRGGMGVVYKALDLALHRTVAVKTLASVPGAESCARFAREAEAIARLDHPHIVPVYEVGEWRAGEAMLPVPFFVMKWYPGGSLDAAPAGPGTDPAAQARAVEAIARAVHHAHQRGVLHRDLKPSNILLDEDGRPHVADFGLAGRFDPDDPRTRTAAVVGTPSYMAPEQARSPGQVTTAADVYGLGAILYHQLTGQPPFLADTPLATFDLVASEPPVRPAAVNPAVPRDLDTVCLKCLEKDPARRYASAEALADDLGRFLAGRSVVARPTRAWEHGWRWVRRHPLVSVMAATTAAALVFAVVNLALSNARIGEKERETAAAYRRETGLRSRLEDALDREQRSLYLERVASAGRLFASNQLPQAWGLLDPCPDHLRQWEWRYLDSLRQTTPISLTGHADGVEAAVFLADGRLVTADRGRAVRVWNVAARTTDRTWQVGPGGVTELAAHPTRNWVAAAGRNFVEVWDADTGERVRRLAGANRVGFSPCGRWAATADRAAARVWALPGWEPKWELTGHTASVSSLAFSPDGERLLTGSLDGGVRTWDLSTGEAIGTPWKRPRPVVGLAFTPDGQALIEAHPEGIVVADPKTGRHQHRVEPTAAGRSFLAVGPTAGWVGVIGPDREVVVWDVSRRRPVRVFRGHTAPVTALAFSRDGRQLASAGVDPAVRIWDTTRDADVRTLAEPGDWAGGLAVAPDGSRLAVGPRFNGSPADHRVLILDAATGRERRRLAAAGDVAFHPDSRRLATGRPGGGVMLWDAETGAALWNSPAPEGRREAGPRGCRMAFSPEGSWLAVWPGRGGVQLLDAESGSDAGTVDVGNEFVYAIGFSADGTRMAVATAGELVLWDVLCRSKLPRTEPARGAVAVAHSPDGRQLVSADRDRVVRLRVAATGKPIREFIGGATQVNAVAFSPDGTRIVTGGSDGTVRVWDAETGRELLALPGVTGPVVGVAWDRAHDRILALDDALRGWSRDGW